MGGVPGRRRRGIPPFVCARPSPFCGGAMQLLRTLRLTCRSLARRPAYTGMVVAILAVGIGANAAIFSLVDAVLVRSLPYAHPESLVVMFADGTARGQGARLATTPGDLFDWRAQTSDTFSAL